MGEPMSTDADRFRLISEIESIRDARVLSLVLGDRRGHETKIAGDVLPLAYEHLRAFGHTREIALFLYTTGGDTVAGWGLVNLLREYCDKLAVIAPFRCLSTGTLIALGADEIVLAAGAQLGPIDPSVSSPYNPPAPGPPQPGRVSLLPVSVEDLVGFVHFVKDEGGVRAEEPMARILASLADKVHPLALGAVHRAREQVNELAKKLLRSHMDDDARAEEIANWLGRLPSHNYIISRREARTVLGDDLVRPIPEELEPHVWSLYRAYDVWLELTAPYSADVELGDQESVTKTFPRAALESRKEDGLKTHVFRTTKELRRVQMTQPGLAAPVAAIQERTIAEGWTAWPEESH